MKILYIGHGFIPYRKGGSIIHADALMQMQVKEGSEVYYFFSGRVFPFIKKPKLVKWIKNDIKMFEILNSPIIPVQSEGIRDPESHLNHKFIEKIFRDVMKLVNPDIIHIQELLALPTSLIDIVKEEFDIPLILTAHDYSILCPTVKLFKYDNTNCTDNEVGVECCKCCHYAPVNNNVDIRATIAYHLEKFHIPAFKMYDIFLRLSSKFFVSKNNKKTSTLQCGNYSLEVSYQKRRDLNIKRARKIDLIIAHSDRSREILSKFYYNKKINTIHPTPEHLKLIQAKKMSKIHSPLNFGTLNGCASIEKGADLILETLKILDYRRLKNKFNFHIWGNMSKKFQIEFLNFDNVHYHGDYPVEDLNEILNIIDVGVVPSLWEEVYGFVGLELLKKGIPIIGNERGGIPDYVIETLTGWLNKSATPEELADIMQQIINNPKELKKLNKNIINMKFKTFEENFQEINELYTDILRKTDFNK